jgi:hypothetical protein
MIDNPQILATLDTQDTTRRQTKQNTQHRKLKTKHFTKDSHLAGKHQVALYEYYLTC